MGKSEGSKSHQRCLAGTVAAAKITAAAMDTTEFPHDRVWATGTWHAEDHSFRTRISRLARVGVGVSQTPRLKPSEPSVRTTHVLQHGLQQNRVKRRSNANEKEPSD